MAAAATLDQASSQDACRNKQTAPDETSERERSRLEKQAGKIVLVLTLVSFTFIGLLINLAQLLIVCSSKLSSSICWRKAHKRMLSSTINIMFAQPVFALKYWAHVDMEVVLGDMKLLDDLRRPLMCLFIANHSYQIDWIACFAMADMLGNLGSYKCFSKNGLKYFPICGWALWMCDLIYVERNWDQDKKNMTAKLEELLYYEQTILGLFCEGTRYSKEKFEQSVKFAQSRAIEPFKHHLFPRPRGFAYTMRYYLTHTQARQNRPFRLLNIQISMPDNPSFADFVEGRRIRAHFYCEEVALNEDIHNEVMNCKDQDDCPKLVQLLQDIYRRKDELMEEYERNKRFIPPAKGGYFPVDHSHVIFFKWFFSMCFTYGVLGYLGATVFAHSVAFWTFAIVLLVSGRLMLHLIERESKVAGTAKC